MNDIVTFVVHNVVHNTVLNCDGSFVIHNCLKRSQLCVMNDIMNNTVNNKKGHNIVNDKQLCS